jgi:hypothetical protein
MDTMGEIGFLSRSAMAEPRDESESFPRNLMLDSMIQAALAMDGPDPSKAGMSKVHISDLNPAVNQPVRLPRDITSPYLSRFIEEVSLFFPFLDGKALTAHYEMFQETNLDSIPEDLALPYFDVCLAIAIGALMRSSSLSSSTLVASLHLSAVRKLPIIYDRNSLTTVYCVLLLAIFSIASPSGGSAWYLIGLAMRTCVCLGLNKEPEDHLDFTYPEIRERRNTFWSAYLLDRYVLWIFHVRDIVYHLPPPFRPAKPYFCHSKCNHFSYT